ncbi:uncharacterized protein BX663DRAFT_427508 [Cokeromyces recurvatus]|uniref:uncharacterized protein n=1 Tax=Cokeromyces recurvatus TaxID=90255 RepID=UPI00221EBF53|nr:uncharacterized protein BX663DRAFT_427508 [Cokeromyces recurvatus]KAI7906394.1 hypothetical protein BX663DRAFT_427508 [Cokeromyces recurvatus]
MFKKPLANLKSFSPLRSSDRRRFQNEAYNAYPSLKEICTSDEEGAPHHLMPDDLQAAKFVSHVGTPGIVYKSEKQALWISIEKLPPIPTVYTMWQYPNMLPKLYTWSPVIHKLMEGAVLGSEGALPTLNTGDLVAITIKGYSTPLAIGTMALPTSDIKIRSGMKGKAVHIIHVYQDYLWAMGDKSDPLEFEHISNYDEEEDDDDDEEEDDDDDEEEEKVETKAKVKAIHDEKIDEWLKKSLYQALIYKIKAENISTILPISASSFYSAYIMPCRPADIGTEVDIKKSSWKKLQKFLKTMEKSGLLKTKEQRGETMIISVNYSHPNLQEVNKYKTMEIPTTTVNNSKKESTTQQRQQKDEIQQADIQELFKPLGDHIIQFFKEAKHEKDKMYTIPEIRNVLSDYIKLHQLADPKNQKMIMIDPILCDAILAKDEYNTIQKLGRDQILHRICQKMQPFHLMTLPGKEPVLRKGYPKPIEITQEIRQGRKTITKITGVEGFGLDIEELAKELTRLCASSATYNPIQGVSPKNPLFEIMVQGPQIKNVTELMISKGVPRRFIDTFDKTSKKGRR